jgi:hypothetical protein
MSLGDFHVRVLEEALAQSWSRGTIEGLMPSTRDLGNDDAYEFAVNGIHREYDGVQF